MSGPADAFARDDAAYVLGVLPDSEREAFEQHLAGCADCRARVDELRAVPALLGTISVDDLDDVTAAPGDERLPDTLLPSLLRAAAVRRRRTRAVVTGLAALAAACVIALVVAVWPSSPPAPARQSAAVQNFVSLVRAPISASAVLTARNWGTEIDLKCVYAGVGEQPVPYEMYAYDAAGHPYDAGGWKQGAEVKYVGGTSLDLDKIAKIEIKLHNKAILRLTR